jgi:hypothetical protein
MRRTRPLSSINRAATWAVASVLPSSMTKIS